MIVKTSDHHCHIQIIPILIFIEMIDHDGNEYEEYWWGLYYWWTGDDDKRYIEETMKSMMMMIMTILQ